MTTSTRSAEPEFDEEWYKHVVALALGFETLRDFQLELSMEVGRGKDVVFVGPTGAGKSALFYVPLMAAKLKYGKAVALIIVPTKALAEDQARSANLRGLCAVPLTRDYLRAATMETSERSRKVFDEIEEGEWDLVVLSPEMLKSKELTAKLRSDKFVRIFLFEVDTCLFGRAEVEGSVALVNVREGVEGVDRLTKKYLFVLRTGAPGDS